MAILSCLLLLSQQGAEIWLRGGALILVGVLLFAGSRKAMTTVLKPGNPGP